MPQVVFRICPACAEPTTGGSVELEPRRFVCDLCMAATPIEPLPPLLFLTGASGAGKTTLYDALVGRVDEAFLVDQDLLWGVNPAHNDPDSGYRQFRGLILHLAERLARNGKPIVVEGSCMPDQYESLGERWYFAQPRTSLSCAPMRSSRVGCGHVRDGATRCATWTGWSRGTDNSASTTSTRTLRSRCSTQPTERSPTARRRFTSGSVSACYRPRLPTVHNDGSGRAAPRWPCPRMREHNDVGHRPEVLLHG
jgi:hypothetical protein